MHLPSLLRCELLLAAVAIAIVPNVSMASLHYIDTSFENASPLYYEEPEPGKVEVFLVYDQERNSPNRANGHWHFQLQGDPGTELEITLNNLDNVWNGKHGFPGSDASIVKVSEDGQDWGTVETEVLEGDRLRFNVSLRESHLYVAHVEPYRISDLNRLIAEIENHPLVHIETIGETVQGRQLEVIRIGHGEAPHRVVLRARAHPWEPGGNWVVQGLIRSLLSDDPDNAAYLERYAVYVMPMANKDGVANGWTRFNQLGKDLNRDWDRPADPELAPENAALERWIERMIDRGKKPDLLIDLHNDQRGLIHISRPNIDLEEYLKDMDRYESLMRKHTWFTEGRTGGNFRNPGTIGNGVLERYGVTGLIQELNANWIEGLKEHTSGENWERLGSQYRRVFFEYFE